MIVNYDCYATILEYNQVVMSETILKPLTPAEQDERYLPMLPAIEPVLFAQYDKKLPYHAAEHAIDVRDRCVDNREMLIARGVKELPGLFVTIMTADGHDAGTMAFFRGRDKGFDSAEAYASFLTGDILEMCGVDSLTIKEIQSIQKPTKAGIKCQTWGEFNLCESDLFNTSQDYDDIFMPTKEKLRREYLLLKGEDLGEDGYSDFSLRLLAVYNLVNLNFDRIGEVGEEFTRMKQAQAANLQRLFTERVRSMAVNTGEQVLSFARKLGEPLVRLVGLD